MRLLLVAFMAALSVAPPAGGEDPSLRPDARAVLIVGITGTALDPGTLFHLRDGGRGVILLGPNVTSAGQIRDLARQTSCATGGNYLLAVDHEPLRVQRLRPVIGTFVAPATDAEMRDAAAELGRDLIHLGVTMDLAPVLDLTGTSPALRGRTFSGEPAEVSALGEAFRWGVESAQVAAVVKHFPGHGRAPTDPHISVTHIDGPTAEELTPFQTAVALGARAVMVGHPIYSELDPDTPASSSPAAYDLLRSWGFDGVAMTDALGMVGARNGRSVADTAVAALRAGADLLIIEDPAERETVVDAIVGAVRDGTLDRSQLAHAAVRVRRLAAWSDGIASNCGSVWVRE